MLVYKYFPFSNPKFKEIEAAENPENPDFISIHSASYVTHMHKDSLDGDTAEYFSSPRKAIEGRISTQKRILEREANTLTVAEQDLGDWLE